jgi:hypothetical protein
VPYHAAQAGEGDVTQYLLSIYQPDGEAPPPEALAPVMQQLSALISDAKRTGAWVFNGGLHPPGTATVVRYRAGDVLVTDGPFAEGKEHIGGFLVVTAADLDGALDWARRLARILTLDPQGPGLAVEVRPFQ